MSKLKNSTDKADTQLTKFAPNLSDMVCLAGDQVTRLQTPGRGLVNC